MEHARLPRTGKPYVIPLDVARRALQRFTSSATGCHISTYSVGSHGYAQIGWERKDTGRQMTTAHRAAWVAVHGQIPFGVTIDHRCHTRRCVNVEHLRALGNTDNAARTNGRDWPLGECPKGHPDSERRQYGSSKSYCRACHNEYRRARRAAKRGIS